jgi:hypothetical protein
MATKKTVKDNEREIPVTRFTKNQLLRLSKYKTLAAKVALKDDCLYSFAEADAAIDKILRKKG